MKLLLLTAACVFTINTWAQAPKDSAFVEDVYSSSFSMWKQSYQPVLRITAKEIENLPFTNIMEVINGAFPFVFADPPSSSEYNFLVDGNLLANPHALNISQIAWIEFYPVAFDRASGSMAGKGTFVIGTKKNALNGFNLRSQTGIIFPTDKNQPYNPQAAAQANRSKELFTNQEFGYAFSNKEVTFTTALALTRNAVPGYKSKVSEESFSNTFRRGRFSGFVEYNASDKIKLLGGLLLHGQNNITNAIQAISASDFSDEVFYLSVNAGMQYRITPSIVNTFKAEYAATSRQSDAGSTSFLQPVQLYDAHTDYDERQFVITNETKGVLFSNSSIDAGWQLLLRFYDQDYEQKLKTEIRRENGDLLGLGQGFSKSEQQSLAVMPRFSLHIARQLLITAGLTYDHWKDMSLSKPSESKVFPYGGINWTISHPGKSFSLLRIHSTYNETWQHATQANWLDPYGQFSSNTFGPTTSPGIFLLSEKKPAYTWVTGVDAGFAKDKFVFSVNYLRGNAYPLLRRLLPVGSGFSYSYLYDEVTRSGLSAAVQATIAESRKFSMRVKAIAFYQQYELKNKTNAQSLQTENPILNDHLDKQWHGSIRTNIETGNFFLQAIGLIRLNELHSIIIPGQPFRQEKSSNHGLTFLTIGYNVPLKSKRLNELQLSIQTRNLGMMKEPGADYYTSRYVGLGVRLGLK